MLKLQFIIIYITLFVVGCSTSHLVSVDENNLVPKLVNKPLFIYPHTALANNIAGKVHLILKVNKKGKVDSVIVEKSSGYDVLDKSAISFVKQFEYKPVVSNGQPIQFYMKE